MTHTKLTALRKRVGAASGTASYVALACECIELCEALEAALRVVDEAVNQYRGCPVDLSESTIQALMEFRAAYPDLLEEEK